MTLAQNVSAINSLREVLNEERISHLNLDDNAVTFSVLPPESAEKYELYFSSGETYPCCPGLLVATNRDDLDLDDVNASLKHSCSISKAIVLLGRLLHVDLDWVEEATREDACGDRDEYIDLCGDDDVEDTGMLYEDEDDSDDDEVLREWSRRLAM